jgi:hypothetical protein
MQSIRLLAILSLGLLSLTLTPALHAADKDVTALAATINARVTEAWGKDVQPAALADDAEFFRRVHLDLIGRIPSVTEIRDFLDDNRADKRRLWVDRMLRAASQDPSYKDGYVRHFTNVWRDWLLAQSNQPMPPQVSDLEAWLGQRLRANVGYDRLVRELLTPSDRSQNFGRDMGSTTAFYQANEFKPENLAGSTARLFLGVKLECAQCHKHPFDHWTRTQFWEFAGFFTDVVPPGQPNQADQPGRTRGEIKIPVPGQDRVVRAHFLDGTEPMWPEGTATRPTLAVWMTAADNPYFARAVVNRLWTYFFGVGLADPADGTDATPPAAHKELLDELARQLVSHDYDLKFLIRALVASQAYQRTSTVSHPSQKAPGLFARMPLRGMSPEQLFDSLAEATEYERGAYAHTARRGQFLARFAAQQQKTNHHTSILQALYLMNNEFVADRTSLVQNPTLATLAEQRTSTARKVESLFLVVLSRKPRADEVGDFVQYVRQGGPVGDSKQALADIFWVLLNSPEFVLNH